MKHSKWLKVGLPFAIVLIAAVVAKMMIEGRKAPEQKPVESKALLVETLTVGKQAVEFTVSSQGNVVPLNRTSLSAQVGGRVVSMADGFVTGGMFKKGDVLITLEQEDYVTEVKLAAAELAQAQASLAEERARAKVAEQEWRSVDNVLPPELGLRKPQLAKEQANVQAAEAKLERANRNLQRTQIRAPYNGLVVSRSADIGQFVSAGSALGEIYATNVAEVRLPITDRELAFIDLSAGVTNRNKVDLSAVVAGKTRHWHGELVRTEGVMDSGNRVIYAIVQVIDPYLRESGNKSPVPLRFGQFVQASIHGTQRQELFSLPRSVLRLDNTVLVVNNQNQLDIREVVSVRSTESLVYLSDGLLDGERVVVSAVPNPFQGMEVRVAGDPDDTEKDMRDDSDSIQVSEAL
ncbi:efflux RND transporter periplasmic adaptor subunit [Alteromonas aestuariivivens]|uniref:Efflux RND transporter periplasmic adaptor subunit n=1 Tax=Alteromonas aestuariivivens TaxID=1938339 RepID=A0A3D8MBB3_9ALTE|nr:efflux RND transporter periplasmic adaptor subunit [Alteromonas aestuariivivens]RDV27385.1 efflux RND transporter periplasmic adaptor subunit [Alteromonas aestuariivivens]